MSEATDDHAGDAIKSRRSPGLWTLVSAGIGMSVAATFLYAFVDAQSLRRDAGVFPEFVAVVGLVLLGTYLARLAVTMYRGASMSTVVVEEDDVSSSGVALTYALTSFFFVSTWLIGFHLAVPLFVVLYLRRYAAVRYRALIPTFVIFVALITVVYGDFMATRWPESLLESRFMSNSWQRTLMPLFEPLLGILGR